MEAIVKMNLGIITNEQGQIVNHRSLLKVLFNPFLRVIGWHIVTIFDPNTNELGRIIVEKCPKKTLEFSFDYKLKNNQLIKQRRLI